MHERWRQLLAVATAVALVACHPPCEGSPALVNDSSLSDEAVSWLPSYAGQFLGWMPSDEVCLAEIAVHDDPFDIRRKRGAWHVTLDAASPAPGYDLAWALCKAVDREARLWKEARDHFDDREAFLVRCARGPSRNPYEPQAAVCGPHKPDAEQRFMDQVVFPHHTPIEAPPLAVRRLPDVPVAGAVLGRAYAATVDDVVVLQQDESTWSFAAIDLDGLVDLGASFEAEGFPLTMAADTERVVALMAPGWWEPGTLYVLDRATGHLESVPVSRATVSSQGPPGALVGDQLVVNRSGLADGPDELYGVNIRTGQVTILPLPEAPAPLWSHVQSLFAWEDQLWVSWTDVEVEVGDHSVAVGVHRSHVGLLDLDADTWTRRHDPEPFQEPTRYALGATRGGDLVQKVSVPSGSLWATLSPDGHTRVSGDLCIDDGPQPSWIVGDEAWGLTPDELVRWSVGP